MFFACIYQWAKSIKLGSCFIKFATSLQWNVATQVFKDKDDSYKCIQLYTYKFPQTIDYPVCSPPVLIIVQRTEQPLESTSPAHSPTTI